MNTANTTTAFDQKYIDLHLKGMLPSGAEVHLTDILCDQGGDITLIGTWFNHLTDSPVVLSVYRDRLRETELRDHDGDGENEWKIDGVVDAFSNIDATALYLEQVALIDAVHQFVKYCEQQAALYEQGLEKQALALGTTRNDITKAIKAM